MKFIKTYWHSKENPYKEAFYQKIRTTPLYRFALSSLLLTKHHPTELYTNEVGTALIQRLDIPFSKIIILKKKLSGIRSCLKF